MTFFGTFFVKGEIIVLKRDGTWIADGIEITHEQTRDLFYRSIHWDEKEKQYYLEVGYERIFIQVEDTPYFVTALERSANGQIVAKLSNFTRVPLQAHQLRYENESLYMELDTQEHAKFLSAPYYDLLRDLEEDDQSYFITIEGMKASLSKKGV